mgnify:CR=1 FL=1
MAALSAQAGESAIVLTDKEINVHFRKGSLLEYNGVYLAEGPWPAKAYFDALLHQRADDQTGDEQQGRLSKLVTDLVRPTRSQPACANTHRPGDQR